ncbi:hypothetical protein ACGFYF_07005 [Streptomyces lavendulae]|uniref:hypothetical protein n=1 Tax=Streptomyces lavendulae TaxID=1914 RepID=UPI0024A5EFED|nr:hypothetical protein [Streptomyces lavendulae]GLW04110.1 hypothetical protein Slala05_77400 [Streptomyces lavendulae subsp. lavendulae]
MNDDDEPVFKRSKWGTNRYYYNPRNPLGLTLIVISLLFAGTALILMANRAGPFRPPHDPAPWSPPPFDYSWPPRSRPPTTPAPTPGTTSTPTHRGAGGPGAGAGYTASA